ncbi:MAG: OsmC family protein [Bryobacteraceae bacterium]
MPGNTGTGTSGYTSYERSYEISSEGKPVIAGSSDRAFRGDHTRWNPEELLVASLSACHQLWYLHLCAEAGIVVLEYVDDPEGTMEEFPDGSGRFMGVTLRPRVTIAAGGDPAKAEALHETAHMKCFIANSVNFPVVCEPSIVSSPKNNS